MTRRSRFPLAGLLLSLLAALLVVPFLGVSAQAADGDPVTPVLDADQVIAEQALETVQEILEPAAAPVVEGQDLTLALRDLAVTRSDLPSDLRDDAGRLLARPNPNDPPGGIECKTDSGLPCYTVGEAAPTCGGGVCIHRVDSTGDAAAPGYAATVLEVVRNVAARYTAAGYRPPVGDGLNGTSAIGAGNGANVFDVYLADLGSKGLYGYCTTDTRVAGHATAPAYCVLDNDYAEYGALGPLGNLQVTAAHEYFHAVQFAYDVNEAGWFMEATATWAEDEVYDDINDNRQYLPGGPLGEPEESMARTKGLAAYGAWIYFKHLSESYPAVNGPGGMPFVVRQVWEVAAGNGTARQGLEAVLAARGTDLRTQFGWFSAANRRPAAFYSEGAAYKKAPLWRRATLTGRNRSVSATARLDDLASRTIRIRSKVPGHARLRVSVDLARRNAGSYAVVTVKKKGKPARSKVVQLNRKGDETKGYAFGRKVKWVELTLSNAGTADRSARLTARVVR